MRRRLKQTATRIIARRPVYRVLPPGALRTYAALKFHGENSTQDEIARFVQSLGSVPTRPLSVALVAARALFRAGLDDRLDETLTALLRAHPGSAAVRVLRSDLQAFHGDFPAALETASGALDVQPGSAAAAARVVRLTYLTADRARADEVAVATLRRFPDKSDVLWAVARPCTTSEQYEKLQATWDEARPEPAHLPGAIRQLSAAATRADRVDAAKDLYRRAVTLFLAGELPNPTLAGEPKLGGRGAWTAIEDLQQAMDDAGVPFFFAAGTALGLVREGRPIAADGDIDIGVFEADWDREALIEMFTRHPRFDLNLHPQTDRVGLRHRGGSPIDVFRFYPEDGRVWHDGVFVRWDNTPFPVVRRDVRGLAAPLPEDSERYLAECYGDDWRTPRSFDAFTDVAPNMKVTWPEYHGLHLTRRGYAALISGRPDEALREFEAAGEADLAERVRKVN